MLGNTNQIGEFVIMTATGPAFVLTDGSESRKKRDELIYFIVRVIGCFIFFSLIKFWKRGQILEINKKLFLNLRKGSQYFGPMLKNAIMPLPFI